MWIKITNCTVVNGYKTRKNQNIQISVRDDIFNDISKHDLILSLSYDFQRAKSYGFDKFRTTHDSKVIIPDEKMTPEQRLLFERKAKNKTILNNIETQLKSDGENCK